VVALILLAALVTAVVAWRLLAASARAAPARRESSAGSGGPPAAGRAGVGELARAPEGQGDASRPRPEPPEGAPPVRSRQLASIGDLAAGIAHEINNPVAIMVEEAGWLEDLLDDPEFRQHPDLEEFRRALQQIRTQGRRCRDITYNLLSFARRTSYKLESVQLNDLVRDVTAAAEKRAQACHVTLATHCDPALPKLLVAPSEMQQVLVNLINNAIDATEGRRGGRVDVSTSLDGDEITVSVADTGHGIPRDQLDRIFDPFYTTKPVGKGTGLGLSISDGIVERLGGTIRVTSEVGVGSTFVVRLPRRRPASEPPRAPAAPAAEPAPAGASAEGLVPPPESPTVVLVVDPETAFVDALRKRLGRRNVEVLAATSGEEALAQLEHRRRIDVVLLDMQMSGADGLEILQGIKRIRPLVEVLLVSSHTTVESAIEGLKQGAFDYLLKPCDLSLLLTKIEQARARKDEQEQRIVEARITGIALRHP
jgi:signal transduction histidine kinase/CheY-like chemotaxis protein